MCPYDPPLPIPPGNGAHSSPPSASCSDRLDKAREGLRNRGFVLVAPLATAKGVFSDEAGSFWGSLQKLPTSKDQQAGRALSRCHAGTLRQDLEDWWPVTKPRRARKVTLRLGNGVSLQVQVCALQCRYLAWIIHTRSDEVCEHR
jgi:hypothetical protein